MATYLVRRLASACVVIFCVLLFLALLIRLIPGDPITAMTGSGAVDPELGDKLREEMGVNDPLLQQVVSLGWNAAHGDLGTDPISRLPVSEAIGQSLPHTLILAITSLTIAMLIGSVLGVLAAARAGTALDRTLGVVAIVSWTVPAYLGGLLLLLVFVVWLDLAPSLGAGSLSDPADYAKHLVLPVAALAIPWIGLVARMMRVNLLEVINEPYIRTSHALGLSERRVFMKYALKNALIPILAFLALGIANLLAGAVFVELIFARPGLGSLLVGAIETRNFPIVRAVVLIIAVSFVLINLCADVAYRLIDPRVAFERRET